MAITNFPSIINGTYDLYYVPPVSNVDTALDESSKEIIGCLKEGFTLNWSASVQDVKSDCTGENIIDGIYKGIESASISMIIHEWDARRTSCDRLTWPTPGSAAFGDSPTVGTMVSGQKLGTPTSEGLGVSLMALPRAGTPAAINTAAWYFYCVFMKGGEDFSANFNVEDQVVPITLQCYPVAAEDEISVPGTNNKVYRTLDDTSGEATFAADFTLRYWRRKAA